jgi:hypothetical protein
VRFFAVGEAPRRLRLPRTGGVALAIGLGVRLATGPVVVAPAVVEGTGAS